MITFLYDWMLGWFVSCVSGTLSMPFGTVLIFTFCDFFVLMTWNNQETLKCVVEPVKDTIKRVMMKDTEEKQFGSMISCGRHLIKTYGFMRLFRGNFNSNYPNMTQHNLEWPEINYFIQVLLEIFYDFGLRVLRLLWTICCKM